ncbi:hypothetical protein RvY_05440-2 [Ramazzottius varieornatus]|uniref:DNA mismatch repair proteins mutS family domain-containing protein n=1 Tax=Ramazzottius varieornatus TaxID=947166 RepID=A0A1D1UY34_RAMVA|nr:hypothetical protein RvY_05440-2 [Ramazzottius varieornatus]
MNTSNASMLEERATEDVEMSEIGEVEIETFDGAAECFKISEQVARSLELNLVSGKGSLFKLLNKCNTPQGSRLLSRWICEPLLDIEAIENRLDVVEFFVSKPSVRSTVSDIHLKKFPDFAPLVKRLEKKGVSLQDLYRIYVAILKIPALVDDLRDASLEDCKPRTAQLLSNRFLSPFTQFFSQFQNYQELIKQTVDIDYIRRTGEYRILPAVDDDLLGLNERLEKLLAAMERDQENLAEALGVDQKIVKLELDGRLGYLYRVTRKDEKLLRGPEAKQLKIMTVDTKQSGYRFRSDKLATLNEQYLQVTSKYRKAQEKVMDALVSTAASYSEPLKTFNKLLSPLDVFVSLARVAYESTVPYVRPVMKPKETGVIELVSARHPCVETFMSKDFIPNSVRFEQGKETFHIVTGPNMGGKSTYIRQVALNVIMAQLGSYVPCKSATVSLVDGIYTRIGAGDSVSKGVSTFMMEMLEIQEILKCATRYSLIIIDELGRGTSTYDGYGLAYAVSEHIATTLGSYCMFTTHFNELAELKSTAPNVVLSHVAALVHEGGITFQYDVEPGVSGKSFGVNVAQMAALPEHVIQDAKLILQELEESHRRGLGALSVGSTGA